MINLGAKVKDVITGFTGITTGRCIFITGCVQYSVVPALDSDGKLQDAHWFDEVRLEVLDELAFLPSTRRVVMAPGGLSRDLHRQLHDWQARART
jgi:hypothetical protein